MQLSLNRKELTNALNCIAEIREKYPLNKRIDEFINSNKKKHIDQSKLFHEIINLQKEIVKECGKNTLKALQASWV